MDQKADITGCHRHQEDKGPWQSHIVGCQTDPTAGGSHTKARATREVLLSPHSTDEEAEAESGKPLAPGPRPEG